MTEVLRALVEIWPNETGIYIAELPGIYVGAPTLEAGLEALPGTIEQHLAWLASHGYPAPDGPIEVELAEQQPATEGRYGPLFEADREDASRAVIDEGVRVAALARRDLIDVYRSVSAYRRELRPTAGAWSMVEHLRHVAGMEVEYLSALPWFPGAQLPDDPVRALQRSAALMTSTLEATPDEHRSTLFQRNEELWTVRKVLRRSVAHLREHLPWMQQFARS